MEIIFGPKLLKKKQELESFLCTVTSHEEVTFSLRQVPQPPNKRYFACRNFNDDAFLSMGVQIIREEPIDLEDEMTHEITNAIYLNFSFLVNHHEGILLSDVKKAFRSLHAGSFKAKFYFSTDFQHTRAALLIQNCCDAENFLLRSK